MQLKDAAIRLTAWRPEMVKKSFALHHFLFGLYPVIFLYSHNINLDLGTALVRPAIIVVVLIGLVWLLLARILGSSEKAAFIISCLLVLLFSYGHIYKVLSPNLGKALLLIACALFAISCWWVLRIRNSLHGPTVVLNVAATVLIVLPIINIINHGRQSWGYGEEPAPAKIVVNEKSGLAREKLPNIYYIILDGYARKDVLNDVYHYDNSEFLEYLSSKGFYVAHGSNANYSQTILSLASSLNFKYLDDVATRVGKDSFNREPLIRIIRNNRVMQILRNYDYQFVTLTSGYWGVEIKNADLNMRGRGTISEFETLLVNRKPILDVLYGLKLYDPWEIHRNRLAYIFDNLADVTRLEKPSFVLAHIISPHPPFVFGEHGERINQREIDSRRYFTYADGVNPEWGLDVDEYKRSYRAQVAFVNDSVRQTIDSIITASRVPPIIILQADHGPSSTLHSDLSNPDTQRLKERMHILNAYYLPNNGDKLLYQKATPVNTFRVVLNYYFGAQLEMLRDENYFSTWNTPYQFVNVTQTVSVD